VSHLTEGKETVKGKNLWSMTPFIREGEREGVKSGPPVDDGEPTAAELAESWPVTPPLFPVGLTRGRGQFGANPGHCSIGSGPIH
jgi:hypothetical protein